MDILNSLSELLQSKNLTETLSSLSSGGDNSQIASLLPMLTSMMGNKNGVANATPENLSKELDILIRSAK